MVNIDEEMSELDSEDSNWEKNRKRYCYIVTSMNTRTIVSVWSSYNEAVSIAEELIKITVKEWSTDVVNDEFTIIKPLKDDYNMYDEISINRYIIR